MPLTPKDDFVPEDKLAVYGQKHQRPWGHFRLLDQGPGFLVKAILVKGRKRLSLQRHRHRAERWVVVMGTAVASVAGVKHSLMPGETIFVPKGAEHRLENPGIEPLVIIETWIGEDLREDDIERLEDDYGRARPLEGGFIAASAAPIILGTGECELVIPLTEEATKKIGDAIRKAGK